MPTCIARIKEQEVEVDDEKIVGYKIIMKLTCVLTAEKIKGCGCKVVLFQS